MSNPAAAESTPMRTPSYAWPCLIVSLLCGIAIVFVWMWMPAITIPTFQSWVLENNSSISSMSQLGELFPHVMGVVPIGALIAAFPITIVVRKWGPKTGTVVGMLVAVIGTLICTLSVSSSFIIFLVGRFVLGLGLSSTVVSGPTCVSIWFPHSTRGRGMAIWSCWAPLGIFTINAIGSQLYSLAGYNVVNLHWIVLIVLVIVMVLFFVVFRNPRGEEVSEVSATPKPYKEIIGLFKQRQIWCLVIMFAIFNYMNYSFSQYLKSWLTLSTRAGGLAWSPEMAGVVGGLIVACGVLAPIGGFLLDKTPRHLKYICVVAGIASLTICSAISFRNGAPVFAAYVLFFCIGNMMLNGCCRPMIPTYVFKGGATAVALGLSFLTLGQYFGQIFTSYTMHPFLETTLLGQTDPMLAFWALVPVGVVGVILSFMMKPSKKETEMLKAGGGKPNGAPSGASGAGAAHGGAPGSADSASA